MRRLVAPLLLAVGLLALAGCEDPARNKAKAVTTEAAPNALTGKPEGAVHHDFDASTSKIGWVGSKVTGKHEGGFRELRGTVSLVGGAPEKSAVSVEIATASLYTDSDRLAGHLKSADFFDVARFPKATFESTAVKAGGERGAPFTITGNLTLHGVTKSITFPANVRVGSDVEVDAEFAINRKDFGLVYAGKPDDLIRDEVVITLAIRSLKKT